MTCHSHPFGDPSGLACIRADVHTSGHIYSAAWAPDVHDESERRACA